MVDGRSSSPGMVGERCVSRNESGAEEYQRVNGIQDYRDSLADILCRARNGLRPHGDTIVPAPYAGHLNKEKLDGLN